MARSKFQAMAAAKQSGLSQKRSPNYYARKRRPQTSAPHYNPPDRPHFSSEGPQKVEVGRNSGGSLAGTSTVRGALVVVAASALLSSSLASSRMRDGRSGGRPRAVGGGRIFIGGEEGGSLFVFSHTLLSKRAFYLFIFSARSPGSYRAVYFC